MFETNNHISYKEVDGVAYLQFPIFSEFPLVHGFSTKYGGVSQGEFATMNFSFTRGDSEEDVKENFCRFAKAVGFSVDQLVLTDQVHSTNILKVGKKDSGEALKYPRTIREIDGLVTDEPGVMLMTFFADCVPLLFYDPMKQVVGNAHSGWRGTVNRMGQRMVETMRDEYGCKPGDIRAVVGPSICQKCYEVSEDVIEEVNVAFDKSHWDSLYYAKPNHHYQLNLWKANEIILQEAGLSPRHIQVCGVCTNENSEVLFSHRFTGGKRGNLAAVIGLK